ncbi:hypothetical protein V490_00338 [Pseudogymnoascus sp. VKM F-3557]|nr:hypothetical protein V490_00338 [Pseudogymnoascus sp. VKM F-3557]
MTSAAPDHRLTCPVFGFIRYRVFSTKFLRARRWTVGITIIRTLGLAPKRPKRQPDAASLGRFAIVCNTVSPTRNCWVITLITMSQSTESDDSSMSSPSGSELPPLRITARDLARLFGHLTPPEDADDKGIITKCITQLKYTVDDHEDRVRLLEHQPYAGSPNEPATDVPTASSFERLQQEVKGLDEVVNERDIRVSEAEEDIGNIKAGVEEFQDFMDNGNIVTDQHLREILPTLVTKTDLKTDLEELRFATKAGLEELRLATKTDLEGLRLEIRASQNYRASRFIDVVQSLPIIRDQDGVRRIEYFSTSLRHVKHYWNLHNQENASELVRCLEFYLTIDNWPFKALDEADDFDYIDVDLLGPLLDTVPKSWEEAVKLSPRRSVYMLFGALGLRYEHFSEQHDTMKAMSTQRRSATKSKLDSQTAIRTKRVKNLSSGSTTDPFTT